VRVFVLTSGRSGSTTFAHACGHMTNLTSAHESLARKRGDARFDYPDDHVEVDNRLSWMLGPLAERFPDARYVHLRRDREAVARSFLARWSVHPPPWPPEDAEERERWQQDVRHPRANLASVFANGILTRQRAWPEEERLEVMRFLVDTIDANLRVFLADRPHVTVDLETVGDDFPAFWRWADAEGDLAAAMAEFGTAHNATST